MKVDVVGRDPKGLGSERKVRVEACRTCGFPIRAGRSGLRNLGGKEMRLARVIGCGACQELSATWIFLRRRRRRSTSSMWNVSDDQPRVYASLRDDHGIVAHSEGVRKL